MAKVYEYRVKSGTHRHGKKTYKVGESFKSDCQLKIKNKLVLVGSPEDLAERRANASQPTIAKADEPGRYNVMDEEGNAVNDKPLTKKQAANALAGLIAASIEDDDEGEDSNNDEGGDADDGGE